MPPRDNDLLAVIELHDDNRVGHEVVGLARERLDFAGLGIRPFLEVGDAAVVVHHLGDGQLLHGCLVGQLLDDVPLRDGLLLGRGRSLATTIYHSLSRRFASLRLCFHWSCFF